MSVELQPIDVCAFWVGDAIYGIDVARVDEILPRVVPLPVVDAPTFVEGVVHVHGTAVPIVDLRRLLPPAVVWASGWTGWRVCGATPPRRSDRVARCLACWVSPRTSAGSWISASC